MWQEEELKEHIQNCFRNPENLKQMGLDWTSPEVDVDCQQDDWAEINQLNAMTKNALEVLEKIACPIGK